MIIVLCVFHLWKNAQSQMMADITEDVQTDFGTYHPYPAVFTPSVPLFTVASDFNNVENFAILRNLGAIDSTLLRENHFLVRYSGYKQLFDIYNDCTWDGIPIFVTTDAVLHIYHVFFDNLLARIEMRTLMESLKTMTEILISKTSSDFGFAENPVAQEALRRNLAYLYVGKKLMEDSEVVVPETVTALVDSELILIETQKGFDFSPIFGNFSKLDYSQFKVRGHYTRNDSLKAYFKTMMWYGWTIFTMEPELFGDLAYRHTLQALVLTQMIYNLETQNETLFDLWNTIYNPTVFLVGKTDDPNPIQYKTIADEIYGPDFLDLDPDSLANTALLEAFMTEAQKLPEPLIPNWIYGYYVQYKGFRFMGQRFIPDSYMFAHLIYPYVGTPEHQRTMPKGLDIMAILGSDRAYTLLDSVYQETSYLNYPEKIADFNFEFSNKAPEEWAQNLYWNWFYCLMPLLYTKGVGYPFFMQTLAWADKELMAALASWAELRHDTILYAKQSMTPCGIAPDPPKSYVEPNPHLYARLASLVRYTNEGLQELTLLLPEEIEKLDLFKTLLLFLRDIAIKELQNTALTTADYENIFCFGGFMEDIIKSMSFDKEGDDMAVVADVHTDSNYPARCLEEGVGYPLEIWVIVNEGGHIRLTRGAMFSYYEFTKPVAERLTDEDWRELLAGDTPPEMPEWKNSYMDPLESTPEYYIDPPANLYYHEFSSIHSGHESTIPAQIDLCQNYPNPFNPVTTIQFDLPKPVDVKLEVVNLLGQRISILINRKMSAGNHTAVWNGKDESGQDMASGLYLMKLTADNRTFTKKMFLIR